MGYEMFRTLAISQRQPSCSSCPCPFCRMPQRNRMPLVQDGPTWTSCTSATDLGCWGPRLWASQLHAQSRSRHCRWRATPWWLIVASHIVVITPLHSFQVKADVDEQKVLREVQKIFAGIETIVVPGDPLSTCNLYLFVVLYAVHPLCGPPFFMSTTQRIVPLPLSVWQPLVPLQLRP